MPDEEAGPELLAVCVGEVETVEIDGRQTETAIRKRPADGAVRAAGTALEGDGVGNPSAHGGTLMSLYAYADEDARHLAGLLGRELPPGSLGENLRTSGLDVTGAKSGDRWRVGDALLEVTVIRTPCFKLRWALGEPGVERTFQRAARPGAYLTIIEPGEVAAADEIRVVRRRADHDITMGLLADAFHNDRRLREDVLDEVGNLAPEPAAWIKERLG